LDRISKTNGKGPCRITEEDLMRHDKSSGDGGDDYERDETTFYADDNATSLRAETRLRVREERAALGASTNTRKQKPSLGKQLLTPLYDLLHPSIIRTTVLLTVIWWALNFGWYGLTLWLPTLFSKVGSIIPSSSVER
jgi:hypothetical protein